LVVAAAVCPNNFHKFLHQIRYVLNCFFFFTQLGAVSFNLDAAILFNAMIFLTTRDNLTRFMCGVLLPAIVVIPMITLFVSFTSYVGRVAYHGMLLSNTDGLETSSAREPLSKEEKLTHKKAAESLCTSFFQNCVTDEEDVLEYCLQTNQRHSKDKRRRLLVPTHQNHYFGQAYTVPKFQGLAGTNHQKS
jgi:hypothetical protein